MKRQKIIDAPVQHAEVNKGENANEFVPVVDVPAVEMTHVPLRTALEGAGLLPFDLPSAPLLDVRPAQTAPPTSGGLNPGMTDAEAQLLLNHYRNTAISFHYDVGRGAGLTPAAALTSALAKLGMSV